MGAIRQTTKREVLQRAKTLLESSHDRYKNRVFVMAGDELPPNIKDHDILTVSLTGGDYDFGAQVGGSENVLQYQGTLKVSLWHTDRQDRQGTDEIALTNADHGLFVLQAGLLKAMIGSLLPGTVEYDPILTQCIYAINDTEATRESDGTFGKTPAGAMVPAKMSIMFGVDFQWDLTAE